MFIGNHDLDFRTVSSTLFTTEAMKTGIISLLQSWGGGSAGDCLPSM